MIRIRNLPSIIFLNLFSLRNVSPQTPSSEVRFGPWDSPAFLQNYFWPASLFEPSAFHLSLPLQLLTLRKLSLPYQDFTTQSLFTMLLTVFNLKGLTRFSISLLFRCHLRIFKKKFLCWKTSCSIPFTYFRSKRSCLL